MPILEIIQGMMFVNTCVKFHDNRLRNEVCRVVMKFNPSPPVSIYIRQSQNVQSFDPSGSTCFYMQKKEEVDLSHEK